MGFRFDGTNGYVRIPDSAALKPANVTVEAWVWLDPSLPAGRGTEYVVFKKNTWSAWFEAYTLTKETVDNGNGTTSDRFSFTVSRYGNQVILYSQTIAQRGVWYHVAATYDGNQSVLYVNGVAEGTATPGFALDYDTTPLYIGTSGTWAPYLGMFGGIIDEVSIYNRALSPNEIAAIYNAGSAGKSPISNRPPVANASATIPLTISVNGSNAAVVLNGSLSYDLDGDPLQYSWFADSTNHITNGIVAVVALPVGTNYITLTVSDGLASDSQAITVDVITITEAINRLIADTGNVSDKQSLLATLRAALASIGRGNPISAVNQLHAFQNQVNAQLGPIDPTLAQMLIDEAQAIIDTLTGGVATHEKVNITSIANGKSHLKFSAPKGQIYIIEASSDLVVWEKIGVAKDHGDGTFDFDDAQSIQNSARFYRIVVP
jgi:hypothetical protein